MYTQSAHPEPLFRRGEKKSHQKKKKKKILKEREKEAKGGQESFLRRRPNTLSLPNSSAETLFSFPMAEALAEPQPATAPSASAAATTTASLFQRRIAFHLERKPYSPISSSGASFNLETLNPSSSARALPTRDDDEALPAASGKRSDGVLDPELSFRITFRRIGAGLANLGNTCFLNSVLQCLTYTEPFAAYLQSGKHKSSCRTAGFCAMCALQNHVMNALQSTGKILAPSHLVKNLRCISRTFRNSRQEDAHEYMVNLLESMHKCCLPSGVPTESPSAYEKSLVHKIFGGRLRSQVQCMQCKFCSNKFDPFLDLSLEIMKADSLRKALAHFTHFEQLDGGERRYQCQRCKQKVRAFKRLTIHKAPHVLTIHLKRFGCHIPGQKIDKKVDFGPTLDLKPFVSDQHEADLKYTLYGVLVHAGWSTHSGHYYCFVRTSSGVWHSLDDNQVRQVSEKTVLAQKAYMLFYVRDRTSAIKGSTGVACKDNVPTNAPGNKMVPQSSCVFTGFVFNGITEGKSRISERDSAICKPNDNSCGQPCAAVVYSKETSSSQKNDNSMPKEAPVLQRNGFVMKNTSCLQMTAEIQAKELMQAALSKDHIKLHLENPSTEMPLSISSIDHPSRLEHNTVDSTSDADNVVLPESRLLSQGKSQFPDVCNIKAGSSILAAQLYTTGSLKSSSENHNKNFLKQNNIHVNASAINEISQSNDASCKMDTVSASVNIEQTGDFSQSIHTNECIGEELFSSTLMETQITGSDNGKIFGNLQHKESRENLLKLEEAGLSKKFLNIPKRVNVCLQQDCLSLIGRKDSVPSHTKRKQNKLAKSLLKGPCFGRKQLFLKSLLVCKSKKGKSYKKHRVRKMTKYKVQEGITADDHGKSTSEATRLIGEASFQSSKKRSRPSSNKEEVEGVKEVKCSNGIILDNDRILEKSSKNVVMLATSEQPMNSVTPAAVECNARKEIAYEKRLAENNALSELMSFKHIIVPRWDDDVPGYRGFGDARSRSIGYVLDEWDEEYDRGKKKKVKKSKHTSGGPNLFQEFANMKIQQNMKMTVNQIQSGNQPLRI
ncbi:ubiquitin carboxyl-terminal hydrolase 36 [Iris pallida]|uniref:Ubiquitin carboxyl-terminal hydrolase 36 n=1 Tax=Iris pallida TaxID=29817 RepID=A0AAX6GFY4_IRIPA|nr:ubiquitin carboxyl-terminal hydrolase 36 [Iris pallida]